MFVAARIFLPLIFMNTNSTKPSGRSEFLLLSVCCVAVFLLWWWPMIYINGYLARLPDRDVDDRSGFYFVGAFPVVMAIAAYGTLAFARFWWASSGASPKTKRWSRLAGLLLTAWLWSWLPMVVSVWGRTAS